MSAHKTRCPDWYRDVEWVTRKGPRVVSVLAEVEPTQATREIHQMGPDGGEVVTSDPCEVFSVYVEQVRDAKGKKVDLGEFSPAERCSLYDAVEKAHVRTRGGA